MHRPSLFHWIRRHMGWLLWLAFVLPVVQVGGAAHVYSHLQDIGSSRGGDPDVGHVQHCPICPAVAAIGAGGLPSAPCGLQVALPPAVSRDQPAPHAPPVVALRRPANRGPPLLLA